MIALIGLFFHFWVGHSQTVPLSCHACLGLAKTECLVTTGCFWSDRISTCGNACDYPVEDDCCIEDALGNTLSGCCNICRFLPGGLNSCIIRWDFHFDICFVVDASESITLMEWNSILEFFIRSYILAITPDACDLTKPDVSGFCPHVGIVQYDSIAQTIIPHLASIKPYYNETSSCFSRDTYLNHLHPGWESIVFNMKRSQDQARPAGGNTWTVLAVQRCADLLVNTYLRQPKTLSLMVVMTDGSPNGPSRCQGDVCDICGPNPEKEDFLLPPNDLLFRFDASCVPQIAGQTFTETGQLQKMNSINARRILVLFKPEEVAFKNDIKLKCFITGQTGTFGLPFQVPTRLLQNVSDLTLQADVGNIIKSLADTVCEFSVAPTISPTSNPTIRTSNPTASPSAAPTFCVGIPSDYVRPDCQPLICGNNDAIVSVNPNPQLTILNGDRTRICWSFVMRNVFGNPQCLTNNDPVRGVSFMMDECCPDGVMNFVELVEMENAIGQIVASEPRSNCPLLPLTDNTADTRACSRAVRKCAHSRRATQDCVVINLNNVLMGDQRGQYCLTVPGTQWKNNLNDELRPGVAKTSKICFERGDEQDPRNPTNVCSCFPVQFIDSQMMCKKTGFPTVSPTNNPTLRPTVRPTNTPTFNPTLRPSNSPNLRPTFNPSLRPSLNPTMRPTLRPTLRPTQNPTLRPTVRPTFRPTLRPTLRPSPGPTMDPTKRPSRNPTVRPTFNPSAGPTRRPTKRPTVRPTPNPTNRPSMPPTRRPTFRPTGRPSRHPTLRPTLRPTARPTGCQGPPPDYQRDTTSASTFGMCNDLNGNVKVDMKPLIIVDDATQRTKFCYEFSSQTPLHSVCLPPQGNTTLRGVSFMFDECCSSGDMDFLQEITLSDMSYNVRQGDCPLSDDMVGTMKGCSRTQRLCSAAESTGDECGVVNLNHLSFTQTSGQFCFSVPGTNFNTRDPSVIDRHQKELGKICFENGVDTMMTNTTDNILSCSEVEIPKSKKLCHLTPQPSPAPTPAPTECEGEDPPASPPQTCDYPCSSDELAEWDPYLYKYEYNEEHDVTSFKYCVDIDKYWFKDEHACIAPSGGQGGKGWSWKGKGHKLYPREVGSITFRLDTCCNLCLTPEHFYESNAGGIDITNRGKSPYFTIPEGYECYMLKFNGHVETRSGLACIEGGKKCACSTVPVPFSCDLKRFANPSCRSKLGGHKGWWRKRNGN